MYVCVNTGSPNDGDDGGNNAEAVIQGIIGGIMGLIVISSLVTIIII